MRKRDNNLSASFYIPDILYPADFSFDERVIRSIFFSKDNVAIKQSLDRLPQVCVRG